jgi:HD-GYP domain-containing protein (c-di-GMP phosphodiesterase class II)
VVVDDLNKYLEEMEMILLNYRGHIDKYMGDGIMAEFGAPVDYETHALQAVLTGLKMQEKVKKENFPWEMRIGIATGEAITGLIGHKRQTYTAIGNVVNLASRVEENCTPGFVTIDEDTYKEVKTFVVTQRKLCINTDHMLDEKTIKQIEELHQRLEADPLNLEAHKTLGFIYQNIKDLPMAIECFKNALDLAPDDDNIKVAFAETSLEMQKQGNIPIRGNKKTVHLYEVKGLRDPLEDREKIPQKLCDRYSKVRDKLGEYPESHVLPVEALDGSIGHSKSVGFLSYALSDSLEMPAKEKEDILKAGYFCDIGMEIVPQHLLNRTGNLTKSEFEEFMNHPEESIRILKKMGYETDHVFEIIEAHHENLNGTGYPKGLKEAEIPLGSRIIAVADMYDTLTSWRPYRERWDYRAAFSEIQKEKKLGKLDPEVVDHLGRLLELETG